MEYVFVEVDMRNDFADDPRAVLPVPGTYGLVGKMRVLEDLLKKVIEVYDNHSVEDPVSQEEFKTFNPHCLIGTWGHDRISGLAKSSIKVPKNTYDFWEGMKVSEPAPKDLLNNQLKKAIRILNKSELIVVGGIVTGICVKAFIDGIIEKGLANRTVIISDCVSNLEGVPGVKSTKELFDEWSSPTNGIRVMTFDDFIKTVI